MLYVILAVYAFYTSVLQGTRPIISLFADSQGASAFVIGLLVSSYALLPMLLAVRVGKWLDRYGARSMITVGAGGMMLCFVIPMVYPNVAALFFSQLVIGISQLFIHLSFQKTVGNWPGNRDQHVAGLSFIGSFGEFLGPLFTGFIYDNFGFRMTLGSQFVIILLAVISGLILKRSCWKSGAPSVKNNKKATESPWKILKNKNLRNAVIIGGLVLFAKDLYVAFFPVYASSVGLSAAAIGVILSVKGAMSMAVRISQFHLVRAFGRSLVLMATLILSGLLFVLVTGTSNFMLLVVMTGALGGALGLGQPLSLVYTLDLSPPERHGEVLGMRITFNRGTQFAAPFLIGGIGGITGVLPIFWITGGILLLGAYLTRIRSSPVIEQAKESQSS